MALQSSALQRAAAGCPLPVRLGSEDGHCSGLGYHHPAAAAQRSHQRPDGLVRIGAGEACLGQPWQAGQSTAALYITARMMHTSCMALPSLQPLGAGSWLTSGKVSAPVGLALGLGLALGRGLRRGLGLGPGLGQGPGLGPGLGLEASSLRTASSQQS